MAKLIKLLLTLNLLLVFAIPSYAAWTERYVDNTLASETKPTGTATGGGATWICLEAGSSAVDDTYNNYGIFATGGTGANQSRRITDYDATGGGNCELEATVNAAWGTNPGADTTYEITLGSDANDGSTVGKSSNGIDGAWRTIDYGVDNLSNDCRLNIKAGREYDLLTIPTPAGDAGNSNPRVVSGYTTTAGDGGRAVLDAQSTLASCWDFNGAADHWWIGFMDFKGATGNAFSGDGSADHVYLISIYVINAGDNCVELPGGCNNINIWGSELSNCTTMAVNSGGNYDVYESYIHDVTGRGLEDVQDVMNNVLDTVGGMGIDLGFDKSTVAGNTIYNTTAGENLFLAQHMSMLWNNLLHTSNVENIDAVSKTFVVYANNNATSGTSVIQNQANTFYEANNTTDDPSLNASTFQIGAELDDEGFPAYFDTPAGGTSVPAHREVGAIMYEETAGGGGGGAGGELFVF